MRGWCIYDEKHGKYYDGNGGFHYASSHAKRYARRLSAIAMLYELQKSHPEMKLVVE